MKFAKQTFWFLLVFSVLNGFSHWVQPHIDSSTAFSIGFLSNRANDWLTLILEVVAMVIRLVQFPSMGLTYLLMGMPSAGLAGSPEILVTILSALIYSGVFSLWVRLKKPNHSLQPTAYPR